MIMTTMGSAYWPQTNAGRVLCILLSIYAFAAFGYVTALLASFFVDRDANKAASPELERVLAELRQLRAELEHQRQGTLKR
jgi:voltage-gated potassium channel